MFDSFGRGFRMIWASLKMGFQDKRLLLPSILTVFTNFFFAALLFVEGKAKMGDSAHKVAQGAGGLLNHHNMGNLLRNHQNIGDLVNSTGLNGPMDQSGMGAMAQAVSPEAVVAVTGLVAIWWLTNRFLEGVTTALVYSHLTEGKGSGKFSVACQAVLSSLPAIIMLGLVTLIAKRIAGWLRDRRGSGVLGFGVNFLAGIVEVFWTLAGHLILPSIVIEGTSFWGALKRADRIAQSNLLTIGVGEVGVDAICRFVSYLVYLVGIGGFTGYCWAQTQHIPLAMPLMVAGALVWASMVVLVTALSVYIRAAFYTCLYVWAIEAEAVAEAERVQVAPPAPLAAALA